MVEELGFAAILKCYFSSSTFIVFVDIDVHVVVDDDDDGPYSGGVFTVADVVVVATVATISAAVKGTGIRMGVFYMSVLILVTTRVL